MRLAGSGGSGGGAGWRVFISHTSELRDFPEGTSYVAAVERAISAAGHVVVDMADFAAADLAPARVCAERVRGCDVYVGCWVRGTALRCEISHGCRTRSWTSTPPLRRARTGWCSCWARGLSAR